MFENIECEWPLFIILLLLDALIEGKQSKIEEYRASLDKIVPLNKEGLAIVPELYLVPKETVSVACSVYTGMYILAYPHMHNYALSA